MLSWFQGLRTAEKLAVFGVLISFVAALVGLWGLINAPQPRQGSATPSANQSDLQHVQADVVTLTQQMTQLQSQVDTLSKPKPGSRINAQLDRMNKTVGQLHKQLASLNSVIVESPTKALELPLLRRDLDSVKAQNQASFTALQQDLDREYDLMKWILGTFVVGIGGMLITVLSSALKGPKANGNP
jgi:hypothetical protein